MSARPAIQTPLASATARSSRTVIPAASSARHMRSPELRQSWLPITATAPTGASRRAGPGRGLGAGGLPCDDLGGEVALEHLARVEVVAEEQVDVGRAVVERVDGAAD